MSEMQAVASVRSPPLANRLGCSADTGNLVTTIVLCKLPYSRLVNYPIVQRKVSKGEGRKLATQRAGQLKGMAGWPLASPQLTGYITCRHNTLQ